MGGVVLAPKIVEATPPKVEAKKTSKAASPERVKRARTALEAVSKGAVRQKRYRENHPEKHREYMRGYMARRRGKGG